MRLLIALAVFLHGLGGLDVQAPTAGSASRAPMRIVSLAPSVTELLFALGLGDRVVGVTSYCRYPPEVIRIPKIGGYLTPSYEALASLRPDLAILLPEHDEVRGRVEALGIQVLRLDQTSVAGILGSATATGERCGATRQAASLRAELQTQLDQIAHTIAGRSRPRVVICMGRNADPNGFRSMSAAGPGGIYDDLIARAGGTNAIGPGPILHPSLSAEALLRIDPDAIVEFAPGSGPPERLQAGWRSLSSLRAVRTGRVYIFTQDFLTIPGPRLIRFVGELARALHPDAAWRHP